MKKRSRGQATLLIVFVLCAVGIIILMNSLDVFNKDYNYKSVDFDRVLLDEATSSSFAVMESALSRRMWEPPPDKDCLKSDKFNVSGTLPNGVSWTVETIYNFTTKNYEMTATGKFKNLVSIFKKRIKVLDVSDYLLFSASDNPVSLGRNYDPNSPAALIARDRRIYTKGPLSAYSMIDRPNPGLDWNGSNSIWPGEYGTIIQGDRMQFGGGIYYSPYSIPQPNPGQGNLSSLLGPYAEAWGSPSKYLSIYGAGSMIFTKDYNTATTLNDQVVQVQNGPLSKNDIKKSVYPVALFGGNPPLKAWSSSDNGTYFNDVDRYSIFLYSYAGANNFGIRNNPTCLSTADAFSTKKFCSHSEHFPKGFKKWRKDADLEGYLYTSDAEAIPAPSMNWDNLEALEEDAQACGKVVDSSAPSYEDCPVWDGNFLSKYAFQGSAMVCPKTTALDMENLTLNNFNPGQLTDTSVKDRLLRRVVYLKGPAEIKQSNAKGLMVTAVSDNVARKNLSLWVVSEDLIALRGFQNDTTSPLTVDPGRLREVVFNQDSSSSGKESLSMVLLSPEQVHLLSPFYVPMTSQHLKSYWPVSGGKIRPINHNLTDDVRYEEDGFKYGYRKFSLNNVSLISSSAVSASYPFYMRGLWSGPDSSASQFISDLCMVTLAGQNLTKYGSNYLVDTAYIPSYAGAPLSPIPAVGSKYYNGDHFPNRYYPNVFWVQEGSLGYARQESDLVLNGIRINVDFNPMVISGKRDLTKPLYQGLESRWINDDIFDLSHKHFAYDYYAYYNQKPAGTLCVLSNAAYLNPLDPSQPYDPYAVRPNVNNGRYIFTQTAPAIDYRNLGSIVGVDQPVIETRNRE
ncbi:MAG: hypothetical protein ACXVCR_18965 [Bdellovibrio sp.]